MRRDIINRVINLKFLFTDRVIRLIGNFLIYIFLARHLGSEKLGQINYVIVFLGFFDMLCSFGLDSIVVRDIGLAKRKSEEDTILSTVIFLRIILFFCLFPIFYYSFSKYFSKDFLMTKMFLILSLEKILHSCYIFRIYFQAKGLSKEEVFASQVSFFMGLIMKVFFILLELDLIYYPMTLVLEKIIFASLLFIRKIKMKLMVFKIDLRYAASLLNEGIPLMLSNISIYIYSKVDQIMLGKMMEVQNVGIYSVGVKLSEVIGVVVNVIVISMLPRLLELNKKKEYDKLKIEFINLSKVNIRIVALYALLIFLFSEIVIDIVYGSEYSEASDVLKIYSIAMIFMALGASMSKYLIFSKRKDLQFYCTFLGGIINIVSNYFLIPKFGINGAAISTIFSQIFAAYLFYTFIEDKIHLKMRSAAIREAIFKIGG